MVDLRDLFQSADWKAEKHVPVIEAPDKVKKGEFFKCTATVGKEVAHPNKTEHHISWIEVFFLAEGEKFPCQIARFEFTAHGSSAQGPDTSTIYTHPQATCSMKTDKPGTIFAGAYCNLHGLWQVSKAIGII